MPPGPRTLTAAGPVGRYAAECRDPHHEQAGRGYDRQPIDEMARRFGLLARPTSQDLPGVNELEFYIARFPAIPWAEPVAMTHESDPEIERFACRICIARNGITATQMLTLPTAPEVIREHITQWHGTI
jgi:hypothetical protein